MSSEIKLFEEKPTGKPIKPYYALGTAITVVSTLVMVVGVFCFCLFLSYQNAGFFGVLSFMGFCGIVFGACIADINVPQTKLVPIQSQIAMLQDIHGGLDCEICGIPARSLEPSNPTPLPRRRLRAIYYHKHTKYCKCDSWLSRYEYYEERASKLFPY